MPGTGAADDNRNEHVRRRIRRRKLIDSIQTTAVVLGSAIIVLIAARNTITWHLERFWAGSGSFWQSHWEKIHGWFNGDTYNMAVWGTGFWTLGVFWFFNGFLLLLDYFEKPKFLRQYKVQEDVHVDKQKLKKAIVRVLFNMTAVSFPVGVIFHRLWLWRGCSFGKELPTFQWVIWELIVCVLTEEIMFYYSHRLVHHPRLYKHIHKVHHEWTAPIGVVALYAHPLEHIVSNILPPMVGPLVTGAHIGTMWLWFAMALVSTSIAHSGFTNNFGVLGIFDRLHGTDASFRASKQYERHFMLLTLVPVRQSIPDRTTNKQQKNVDQAENQCGSSRSE